MPYVAAMQCCGWGEIYMMSSPGSAQEKFRTILQTQKYTIFVCNHLGEVVRLKRGAFIFTQTSGTTYARAFANYAKKHKLGVVAALQEFKNPNTTHIIQTYVWYPDFEALLAHCKKNNWI